MPAPDETVFIVGSFVDEKEYKELLDELVRYIYTKMKFSLGEETELDLPCGAIHCGKKPFQDCKSCKDNPKLDKLPDELFDI